MLGRLTRDERGGRGINSDKTTTTAATQAKKKISTKKNKGKKLDRIFLFLLPLRSPSSKENFDYESAGDDGDVSHVERA